MPTKRQLLKGAGGIGGSMLFGGLVVRTFSQPSTATQINVQELTIPDTTEDTATPVESATLNVNGTYSVDSEVIPDRVILRLEGKRSTESSYQQLAAEEPSTQLAKQFSEDFAFTANLLDLNNVTSAYLTPDALGNTINLGIDLTLTLTVRHDGRTIKEVTVTEETNLAVTKTEGTVNIGINATGNMSVS